MFNSLAKVKPEIKDDVLFQKGLKVIKHIQIGLLIILVLFYGLSIILGKIPMSLQLMYSILMRTLAILALSTGYKTFMIFFLIMNSIGAVGVIVIFTTYLNRLNSLGIFMCILEIVLVIAILFAYIYVFVNKDTKYVIEVTKQIMKEIKEANKK
ncbi:hypothetical protein [Anaerorhabdus furcosa]|uniref:Uncharacterized protein n=1 Tax=Anaerorhabdus furcosa TaxID=118967 RepID=A0A1T4Q3W3_9FIRM|nr:hypothetical protein [Anaerorhabdus furcosa]SJZ98439.1 hypothetical protein SAMN02745191_2304 [Anaerorhabdus furcosa]